MPRITRRPAGRPLPRLLLLALAGALLFAACGGDEDAATPSPAVPTATPTPTGDTPVPATPTTTPTPTPDPAGGPSEPRGTPERQVRDLLLRSAFGLVGGVDERTDVDARAIRLEAIEDDPGQEIWFAVSSGLGVTARLGEPSHAAGIFVRRLDDGWTQVTLYTLQSTPVETDPHLVRVGPSGEIAWIAIFGEIQDAATTFELLRFDGVEFTSALWWFSRGGQAAQLIDLDGDGTREIVLDAADRSVLCPVCAVVEHDQVIYRWAGERLVLVEMAPLDGNGDLADLVGEAVAQARAGLWRRAAATFDDAVIAGADHPDVAWMRLLTHRIAEARLAHAGASAQPLLTHVLAGEYEAAVDLMRRLEPQQAFDPEGPLMDGTHALLAPERTAELLLAYTERALNYDDEIHAAHAVRALALLMDNADRIGEARAHLQAAVALEPDDTFYAAALQWLTEQDEANGVAPPNPDPPPESDEGGDEDGEDEPAD